MKLVSCRVMHMIGFYFLENKPKIQSIDRSISLSLFSSCMYVCVINKLYRFDCTT